MLIDLDNIIRAPWLLYNYDSRSVFLGMIARIRMVRDAKGYGGYLRMTSPSGLIPAGMKRTWYPR
jgi:hypothetical protein